MPNELTRGTRRTGDLYDAHADTPEVKVTLERSTLGISLTIAWSNQEVPYANWFLRDGGYIAGTGPHETVPVPRRVLFHDSHGTVLLIQCWAHGYHANAFGPGSGTLWSRAAILGVEQVLEFDQPHGLQTEISGLRQWLGVRSWKEEISQNQPLALTIRSVDTPLIALGEFDGVSFELAPTWRFVPENNSDRHVLLDVVNCITRSREPQDWDLHLDLHRSVRDLLVLSRWRYESCVPTRAMRLDDPLVTLDGKSHGDQWREVIVSNDDRAPSPSGWNPHLIEYVDLGVDGVGHWIRLRKDFARALDPVISSIDLRSATPHTRLAHTGPGLEALGYMLLQRDGMSEAAASGAPLRKRLDRILDDVADCLPFDGAIWAAHMVRAYNGLKHANRALPDDLEVMQVWAECVIVTRGWVARELGVGREAVRSRLEDDRQPRRFQRST